MKRPREGKRHITWEGLSGNFCFCDNFQTNYGVFLFPFMKQVQHRILPNYGSLRQALLPNDANLCFR